MRQTSAAEFAALSHDVYKPSPKGSKVYAWTRQNFLGDPENGFFAAAYQTPQTKKLIVAFRGTDSFKPDDWGTGGNIGNFLGLNHWNSQLNTAISYFRSVRSIYPTTDCAVCGHSLGGFLASMVAIEEGVPGVAFNPAPLGATGLGAKVKSSLGIGTEPGIVNYRLKGDIVSGLGVKTYFVGRVIELELSKLELWVRSTGIFGDVDPLMHRMKLMEEAILRHQNSDLPPEEW